eukprot:scaffold26055_cov57-Phaeocystis_antarctica.AAC.1
MERQRKLSSGLASGSRLIDNTTPELHMSIARSDDREMSRGQAPPHGEVAGEEVAGEVGPALSSRRLPALTDLVEPAWG